VVVLDPDLSKDYLDLIQNRTKERRYTFDHVYPPGCSNSVCKSVVFSALICNCLTFGIRCLLWYVFGIYTSAWIVPKQLISCLPGNDALKDQTTNYLS